MAVIFFEVLFSLLLYLKLCTLSMPSVTTSDLRTKIFYTAEYKKLDDTLSNFRNNKFKPLP